MHDPDAGTYQTLRRPMRHALLLAVVLVTAAAGTADAQSGPHLEAGDRVRVRLHAPEGSRSDPQTIVGELVAISADSLTIRIHPASAPFAVAARAIARLERSYGIPSAGQSALWLGAFTGALGAAQAPMENRGLSVEKAVLLGGAVGTVLGAAMGALRPLEAWERVPIPGESAEDWIPIDVPRVTLSGGLGIAQREAGTGSGTHLQIGVGLARLPLGTQLRGEVSYQATSTPGGPADCFLGDPCRHQDTSTRRYGAGLTLFTDLGRIGNRFRVLAPVGLGVHRSTISGPGGRSTSCDRCELPTSNMDRTTGWGVMANLGVHAAFRVGGADAFAELRAQIIGEANSRSAAFIPLAVGVSF